MPPRSVITALTGTLLAIGAGPLSASPQQEMAEQAFLDQVEAPGHVLVTARGVDARDFDSLLSATGLPKTSALRLHPAEIATVCSGADR